MIDPKRKKKIGELGAILKEQRDRFDMAENDLWKLVSPYIKKAENPDATEQDILMLAEVRQAMLEIPCEHIFRMISRVLEKHAYDPACITLPAEDFRDIRQAAHRYRTCKEDWQKEEDRMRIYVKRYLLNQDVRAENKEKLADLIRALPECSVKHNLTEAYRYMVLAGGGLGRQEIGSCTQKTVPEWIRTP